MDDDVRAEEQERTSVSTVLTGLIVLSLGVIWLLDIAEIVDVTWTIAGSTLLVLVGIALIVGAREGTHGGLVFIGLVLTVVVLAGSIFTWPGADGGVGDRTFRPAAFENVEEEYNWGVGAQTVDLRDVEFPSGETEIDMQQGMGDLEILLPPDIGYRIHWQVGAGDVDSITREQSGLGMNSTDEVDGYEDHDVRLSIEIRLGMGAIEVQQ